MKPKTIDFRTWFWWVAIHTLSIILTYLLFLILKQVLCSGVFAPAGCPIAIYTSFFAVGIILGTLQWIVMRPVINLSASWIMATGLGVIIAWVPIFISLLAALGSSRNDPPLISILLDSAITGTLVGLIIGSVQWFVIRKRVRRSLYFILYNIIGYSLGMVAMNWMWYPEVYFLEWLHPTLTRDQQSIVFVMVAMLIPAAITGFLISRISQNLTEPVE